MKPRQQQQGFLTITLVFLIVVLGLIAVSVAYMFATTSATSGLSYDSKRSFYLANSGLERATQLLLNPNLANPLANQRLACNPAPGAGINPLNGNALVTNASLAPSVAGTFTATSSAAPNFAGVNTTTLTAAISATDTNINVASTAGYAPQGFIMIDRELIEYSALTATSFTGIVVRAAGGGRAVAHASGARVAQYQCNITSVGQISAGVDTRTQNTVSQSVQLQQAWMAGNTNGANSIITLQRFNSPNQETLVNNATIGVSNNFGRTVNDIAMLNHADFYLTGDLFQNTAGTTRSFYLLRYNPLTNNFNLEIPNPVPAFNQVRDLHSVSVVSSNEAWAVGERRQANLYTILRRVNNTWCLITTAPGTCPGNITIPNIVGRHLYAIDVFDSNGDGFGNIGFSGGANGHLLQYNGSTWQSITSPTNQRINGIATVSTNEAWLVANNGILARFNGTSWNTVATGIGNNLQDIAMLDTNNDGFAEFGIAVGNNRRTLIYTRDPNSSPPGTWSVLIAPSPGGVMRGVTILSPTDAWAVGNGGRMWHYNGNNWSSINRVQNRRLNAIAASAPHIKNRSTTLWLEQLP